MVEFANSYSHGIGRGFASGKQLFDDQLNSPSPDVGRVGRHCSDFPFLGKAIKTVVMKQLQYHLESSDFLGPFQSEIGLIAAQHL